MFVHHSTWKVFFNLNEVLFLIFGILCFLRTMVYITSLFFYLPALLKHLPFLWLLVYHLGLLFWGQMWE